MERVVIILEFSKGTDETPFSGPRDRVVKYADL